MSVDEVSALVSRVFYMANRTWTKMQLEDAIKATDSWRGVQRALGFKSTSAGSRLRRYATELGIDFSHFAPPSDVKRCCECKQYKPFSEFHRRGLNGYQGVCIPCRKIIDSQRYRRDRTHHHKVRDLRKLQITRWMWELKAVTPCADCGRRYPPPVMQWDHIGSNKTKNISEAVGAGWSTRRILRELEGCELVCANCHAIRTYTRRYGDVSFHSQFERSARIDSPRDVAQRQSA